MHFRFTLFFKYFILVGYCSLTNFLILSLNFLTQSQGWRYFSIASLFVNLCSFKLFISRVEFYWYPSLNWLFHFLQHNCNPVIFYFLILACLYLLSSTVFLTTTFISLLNMQFFHSIPKALVSVSVSKFPLCIPFQWLESLV